MDDNIRTNSRSTAANARDKVRSKAAEVADKAKDQIESRYDEQKSRASNEVEHLASALRRASDELRNDGSSSVGAMVLGRVAGHLDNLGSSLQGKDLDELVNDVEGLARRNPAAFIGSALLIGFAASRFLKSSNRHGRIGGDYELDTLQYDTDFRATPGVTTASDFGSGVGAAGGIGTTGGIGTAGGTGTSSGIGSTGRGNTGSGTGSSGSMGGV